jgi:glycyl-tRNA synthetase
VDLSIFKPYTTPIEKLTTKIVPNDSVLGPLLRDKAKAVVTALVSSKPEEVKQAFRKTGHYEIQGFKVLPSHVRFEERSVREAGRRFVPHVVEPSYGAERIVYSTLEYSYNRVKDRVVLRLPVDLVPTQMMVFPLMAKDGLSEIAAEIQRILRGEGFEADYDDGGTVGRRYARADEVGVPLTITVDYQTKENGTVTLRDRDSWNQVRNEWKAVPELVRRFFQGKLSFQQLGTPVKVGYE